MQLGPQEAFRSDVNAGNDRRDVITRDSVVAALTDCSARLTEQLDRAAPSDELRATIVAFAVIARESEVPPERAVALFKGMLRRLSAIYRYDAYEREKIVRQLVRLSIEAYYESLSDRQVR